MATGIPLIEIYWSMVDKADKKFSKIRDLPLYERTKFDTYFYKVFKVYTELWKFQQENRHKLVEAGLKRWEIGEIASRIAQLYFGQYMRTSEASYLSESYVFFEAILTREYFKDGPFHDMSLAHKQLRFLARFITVCLLLNRREMVHQLVNHLRNLLDECKRTFQDANFREWKLVVQEIAKFLKADTAFLNMRPMRYSLVLDPHPDTLTQVSSQNPKRKLKLQDAVLCSYHPNEVKYSEITLDNYRMLQCLEWEPSGALYMSGGGGQSGPDKAATGVNHHSQDISDPTLPPNPRKSVLYRPPITQFIAVLATACDDLPSDGVLLIYLSGRAGQIFPSSLGTGTRRCAENNIKSFQSQPLSLDVNSMSDTQEPLLGKVSELTLNTHDVDCIHIGSRGNEGSNFVYPSDLLPFTRRPLFIVIDSDSSGAFKVLSGSEKGEPVIMLLSPQSSPPISNADSSLYVNGSLFTLFLTAPVQAFCLLLGFSGSDVQLDVYENVDKLLSSSLNNWGMTLATSDSLDPVWSQVLTDPFLRRLLLRFIFCRATLSLYAPTHKKPEFIPQCVPTLPESVQPTTPSIQSTILQIANILGVSSNFIVSSNVLVCKDSGQIAKDTPS